MDFIKAALTIEALKKAWLAYEPKLPLHGDPIAFMQELREFLADSKLSEEEKRFYLALTIMHDQMLGVTQAEKAWIKAKNSRPAKINMAKYFPAIELNECPACRCDFDAVPPIMSDDGLRHCSVCFAVMFPFKDK